MVISVISVAVVVVVVVILLVRLSLAVFFVLHTSVLEPDFNLPFGKVQVTRQFPSFLF